MVDDVRRAACRCPEAPWPLGGALGAGIDAAGGVLILSMEDVDAWESDAAVCMLPVEGWAPFRGAGGGHT